MAETAAPSIAVIIPLYNGAPYIEASLRSVFTQLHAPQEIIVVDDGSIDGGHEIVERLGRERPIRLLRKSNGGQSSARNLGATHTTCKLLAFLDQDDLWYPNHLSELVRPFTGRPSWPMLGWVYSNLDEVSADGSMVCHAFLTTLPVAHPKRDIFSCLGTDMFVLPSAALVSHAAFEQVGGFDERLSGYEDDDLFLRMFRAGLNNIFINRSLSQWRIYPASSSYSARMGRSRMIYARKLFETFPDDPARARYYARDLLFPRFYGHALREYKVALTAGDEAAIRSTWEDLHFLAGFMPERKRRRLERTLWVLRSPRVAQTAFNVRKWVHPVMVRAFH